MIGDYIFFGLILAFYVIFIIWYSFINDKDKSVFTVGDYGKKVKANQIWFFSFFLGFSILSFAFAFLDIKMNITKIVAVAFSALSLGFFFYNAFIKNVKQEEYIALLQTQSLRETPIKEIFLFEEDKADYNLSGNDDSMLIKVIKGKEGFALALRIEDKNLLFNPKWEMTEKEIKFLCKQINIFWTENRDIPKTLMLFEDKNLYEYDKQYVWNHSPKLKPETLKRMKKILICAGTALGGVALLTLFVLFLMESSENTYFQSIADAVYKWLINIE